MSHNYYATKKGDVKMTWNPPQYKPPLPSPNFDPPPPSHDCKDDKDKPRLDLVPPGIIEAVGIVRDYGTRKYKDPDNWRLVEPYRYKAALMRHLCGFLRDPKGRDEESGLPHLWHMACNLAFLVEMYWEEEG